MLWGFPQPITVLYSTVLYCCFLTHASVAAAPVLCCAGNWETMRFLLSNARWWMDEYKFDGYRYRLMDGTVDHCVTHLIYRVTAHPIGGGSPHILYRVAAP